LLKVAVGLTAPLLLLIGIFALRCSTGQSQFAPLAIPARDNNAAAGIQDYRRPQEDTYLTYPEWYIVWSYQEKSDYQQDHLPSGFSYFAGIAQYWRAYCCATKIVAGRYPFNFGDHLMLMVIGSSFTVEYALKGAYEKTLGRLSEWTSGGKPVEEDLYAAAVAKEYGAFVHIRPFYEFSFSKSLTGLWRSTSLWGPHPLRKWERKAFLSLDYGIEAAYCGIITAATHAVYGVESADTYAWIENASDQVFLDNPHMRKVKQVAPDSEIVIIPRYQEFTETAARLSSAGVRFVDIAGNGEVLLTLLLPTGTPYDVAQSELLFSSEIPSNPRLRRVGVRCRVSALGEVLHAIDAHKWKLEHIHDF
jgi:hypothetical protein